MKLIDHAKRHFASFDRHAVEVPEWAGPNGSAILANAKRHFAGLERHAITVPEWADGGAAPVIFAKAMTLEEKQKLATIRVQMGRIASHAHCLVMKAEDEQGARLFSLEDKRALLRQVDPDVIARLVERISATPATADADESHVVPVIYSRPVTLEEKQRMASLQEEEGQLLSFADILILKAEDQDGKRLFQAADKAALIGQVDPNVISRIIIAMMAVPSVKDMEKNLPRTPVSS